MRPYTRAILSGISEILTKPDDAIHEAKKPTDAQIRAAMAAYTGARVTGGKGDRKDPSAFPFDAVRDGVTVEMEHTSDINVALEVATDHLSEKPDYYQKLKGAGLADELKEGLFHHSIVQRQNKFIAAQQHAAETSSRSGYNLDVHYPLKNVPKFDKAKVVRTLADANARQMALHHEKVHIHRSVPRVLAAHHTARMGAYEKALDYHEKQPSLYPHPGRTPSPKTVETIPLEELGLEDRGVIRRARQIGYAKPGPAPTPHGIDTVPIQSLTPDERGDVLKARDAYSAVQAHHEKLTLLAAHYGGESVHAHPDLPSEDPRYHASPHGGDTYRGKPDHLSTFKFKSRTDAFRAITSLKTAGHGFRKAEVHDNDRGVRVMQATPTKLVVESAQLGHGPGALRNAKGHFATWHDKQWTTWVPHVPKAFRAKVTGLGGKVKPSGTGGGLALVFRTHAAAQAAHVVLAQEGHRVNPHDIPGVLLVSFIAHTAEPVTEAVYPDTPMGVVTVHAHVKPGVDAGPQSDAYNSFKDWAVRHGAGFTGGDTTKGLLIAHFGKAKADDPPYQHLSHAADFAHRLKKEMHGSISKIHTGFDFGYLDESTQTPPGIRWSRNPDEDPAGLTPNQQDVGPWDYTSHPFHMDVDQFLRLNPERKDPVSAGLHAHVTGGRPTAPPMLIVGAHPSVDGEFQVQSHEGRGRALIAKGMGYSSIPVQVSFRHRDAHRMRNMAGKTITLHADDSAPHPEKTVVTLPAITHADESTDKRGISDILDDVDNLLSENFSQSFDNRSDAEDAAQEMADLLGVDVAVLSGDDGDTFTVAPVQDTDDASETVEVLSVKSPESVDEGVAKRHRLAARLSAGRIRGRPLGGKRLRSAMRAKRWRLRHRSAHLLNKKTTVYRNQAPIHKR